MTIYTANGREMKENTLYPTAHHINSLQDLLEAAQYDHIFSRMKDNKRSSSNFIETDCLELDMDNTHSEDPDDWKSIKDIAEALPDVRFYYVRSRNHMKIKVKRGKPQEPREKDHIALPLSQPITDREQAKALMESVIEVVDYVLHTKDLLDRAAAKPEQFMFGVEHPEGGEVQGDLCIDEYLEKIAWRLKLPYLDDDINEPEYREQPQEADWIAGAEQRQRMYWLENVFCKKNGITLGKPYAIKNEPHAGAIAFPVTCPWENEHTSPTGKADTVIMIDRGGRLNYLCRHAHCAGHDWAAYRQRIEELTDFAPEQPVDEEAKEKYRQEAAGAGAGRFFTDSANYTRPIATGFETLDRLLDGGLFAGLYALGAVSSLGKTALALQIADQISMRGHDVLFFSLEMSKAELMARSISRITAMREALPMIDDFEEESVASAMSRGKLINAQPARSLLNPESQRLFNEAEKKLVREAAGIYENAAGHLWIIEGNDKRKVMSTEEIENRIRLHKTITGSTPVVFIDYLQIIKSKDNRLSDKQRIDEAVVDLRNIAREYSCPVVVISSFNRNSYNAEVNLASFKESGAIEYSADVLLGLQPVGMKDEQNTAAVTDNKRLVASTKKAPVRDEELLILKNRLGRVGDAVAFKYVPKYNHFDDEGESFATEANRAKKKAEPAERRNRIADALERIAAALPASALSTPPDEWTNI